MESFFATLKQELVYHASTRLGRKQGKTSLNTFKYGITESTIEPRGEDCSRRDHSTLGYASPEDFETKTRYQMAA
jgi:hypothetical protein